MNVYEGKSKWYTIRAKTWSSVHTWQSGQKLPFFFWTEHIPQRGVSLTYWLTSDRPQLEHFMHLPHSCWWKSKESLRKVSVCHTFPPPCTRIFSEHIFNLHIWLTYPFAAPGDGEFLVSLLHALVVKHVLAGGTPSSVLGWVVRSSANQAKGALPASPVVQRGWRGNFNLIFRP